MIYFRFDGLRPETHLAIRGEDLLEHKLLALERMQEAGRENV